MNRNDLYESMNQIDDAALERSERRRGRFPKWTAAAAAVLAVVFLGSLLPHFHGMQSSILPTAYAAALAQYPEMAPYPDESSPRFEQQCEAWETSVEAQARARGFDAGMEPFFARTLPEILGKTDGENKLYAPLNLYMALGLLAEITGGESRQQVLSLLGYETMEELRRQANDVWNVYYRADGATNLVLASSLWLDEQLHVRQEPLDTLAKTYYASSYRGNMEDSGFQKTFQNWLDSQTGGLMTEQAGQLTFPPETMLTLASTVFYQAKWREMFAESETKAGTFHGTSGDTECDFMHQTEETGTYWWGERFGAVSKHLENDGGTMWFFLPDAGVTPEELLCDGEWMDFLLMKERWEHWDRQKGLRIHLTIPKFDIVSQLDLRENLCALGVTDVFQPDAADFSMLLEETRPLAVSKVEQDVRLAIDEEGVTAAAYTAMAVCGACEPPEEEMDFTLDRPFVVVLTGVSGLPLFAGVVHTP